MRLGARGKLFLVSFLLLVLSVAASEIYLLPAVDRDLTNRIEQDLHVRLALVAERAATYATSDSTATDWDDLADKLGRVA